MGKLLRLLASVVAVTTTLVMGIPPRVGGGSCGRYMCSLPPCGGRLGRGVVADAVN
jgi:hypothetical protein